MRGGLSVGLEQPVYRGATITPFLGLRYAFKVYCLDTKVSKGDVSASGDRVSGIEGEYGLTARYREERSTRLEHRRDSVITHPTPYVRMISRRIVQNHTFG